MVFQSPQYACSDLCVFYFLQFYTCVQYKPTEILSSWPHYTNKQFERLVFMEYAALLLSHF